MEYINQELDNKSFPIESALDMTGESGGTEGARSVSDGWVRPTCPKTPTDSWCRPDPHRHPGGISGTLFASPTTGLTVTVTGKAGYTPKIDSTVNVKLTLIMTNDNNDQYVTTYSLYKGATLLVQQDGYRLVYVTVE
jgi:hypothetical protein